MISIIIPALNEEKLLPACLDSLRKQDYSGEYEIIVADNGSRDRTADIARSFGARVIACREKRSVFFARQVGADTARGDIIAQADADTVYPSDWLKRISGWFAAHTEAVAVTGRYAYRNPPAWWPVEYYARHYINRVTGRLFGRPLFISGATFAFRRRAFVAAGGYRDLSYAPDQIGLAERLSKLGKVQYDPGLRILTSSRTVQKPFIIILRDIVVHICQLVLHLAEPGLPPRASRSSRRFAARLLPVPIAVILLVGIHGCLVPSSQVFGQVYYESVTSEKVVALTFDDDLAEPYASDILGILARYNVKATFFLSGENVELNPEMTRRIANEGHVIGNQSYYRDTLHVFTEYHPDDLRITQDIIFRTVGVYPHLYRPPHGTKTPWVLENAAALELIPVTWGVAIDGPFPEEDAGEIISRIEPGKIIRLHDDDYESAEAGSDYYAVVEALPQIIEQLLDLGYKLVTVPELLDVPAYNQVTG
ncbi:MAG: glycosyltransferase [Dehalococcoidia bacterium]|nr:MAG: glycosyltransferase [Dehalococcoidia bacterium]